MARKKTSTKKPAGKAAHRPALSERWDDLSDRLAFLRERSTRVLAGVIIVAIAGAWIVGEGPLMQRVAAMQADPLTIEFAWPGDPAEPTWLPAPIQHELHQIAAANLTINPFDHDALLETANALESTGWFHEVTSVLRDKRGVVRIEGVWRVPSAIVRHDGLALLVGSGGEVLRTPDDHGFERSTLFSISNPSAPPPRDQSGLIAFGIPWRYGEVQPSIRLLREIASQPGARRITGVDLRTFPDDGRLVLLSDTGCRLVWGAPLDKNAPGEVEVARKLERLQAILSQNLDRGHDAIDLYLPRGVVIDRTNTPG